MSDDLKPANHPLGMKALLEREELIALIEG
jgi:hypothetical protein